MCIAFKQALPPKKERVAPDLDKETRVASCTSDPVVSCSSKTVSQEYVRISLDERLSECSARPIVHFLAIRSYSFRCQIFLFAESCSRPMLCPVDGEGIISLRAYHLFRLSVRVTSISCRLARKKLRPGSWHSLAKAPLQTPGTSTP